MKALLALPLAPVAAKKVSPKSLTYKILPGVHDSILIEGPASEAAAMRQEILRQLETMTHPKWTLPRGAVVRSLPPGRAEKFPFGPS